MPTYNFYDFRNPRLLSFLSFINFFEIVQFDDPVEIVAFFRNVNFLFFFLSFLDFWRSNSWNYRARIHHFFDFSILFCVMVKKSYYFRNVNLELLQFSKSRVLFFFFDQFLKHRLIIELELWYKNPSFLFDFSIFFYIILLHNNKLNSKKRSPVSEMSI